MNFWNLHALFLLSVGVLFLTRFNVVYLTWAYILLSSLWVAYSPLFEVPYMPAITYNIRHSGAQCFIQALFLPIILLSPLCRKYFSKIFVIFLYVDACFLLLGVSLFTGDSFDTAILAMFMPFLVKRTKWFSVFPLLTIFYIGGSTAIWVLCTQIFIYLVCTKKWAQLYLCLLPTIPGYFREGAYALTHSNGRLLMWANHMDWWLLQGKYIFGMGLGSYQWIGPFLPFEGSSYMWLHNDWLQILFEGGIVGLFLVTFSFLAVFKNSIIPESRAFIAGTAVCMIFYSPLHFFLVQAFIVMVLLNTKSDIQKEI